MSDGPLPGSTPAEIALPQESRYSVSPEFLAMQQKIGSGTSRDVYRLADEPDRVIKVEKWPLHPVHVQARLSAHRVLDTVLPGHFNPIYTATPEFSVEQYADGPMHEVIRQYARDGKPPREYPSGVRTVERFKTGEFPQLLERFGVRGDAIDLFGGMTSRYDSNFELVDGKVVYLDTVEPVVRDHQVVLTIGGDETTRNRLKTIDPATGITYYPLFEVREGRWNDSMRGERYLQENAEDAVGIFDKDTLLKGARETLGEEGVAKVDALYRDYIEDVKKLIQLRRF